MKFARLALLIAATTLPTATPAQSTEPAAIERLAAEEADNSKIMWLMHQIADVHGPRLTGSPQLEAAANWAAATLRSWNLQNVTLDAWNFGEPGWSNDLTEASVVAPYKAPILARPIPWTPSTKGLITANMFLLEVPGIPPASSGRIVEPLPSVSGSPGLPPPTVATPAAAIMPTRAELNAYLESVKNRVRGTIVLVGRHTSARPYFTPGPLRTSDAEWNRRFAASHASAPTSAPMPAPTGEAGRLDADEIDAEISHFLYAHGARARVYDSGEPRNLMRVQNVGGYNRQPQLPAIMLASADYGRMARVLRDGTTVRMRLNVDNRFHPRGRTAHNVLAEIPGSDRKDELVMLGAHFDSWAAGTGATDNGSGSAMMMEAIRLIQAAGLKPRRTIRLALWTGEEQGVFGSSSYVERHFGSFEKPKPGYNRLSAYVNIDTGTGRPRGAVVFGPPAAAAKVAKIMTPFRPWGFMGAHPSGRRALGGADTGAFYRAGLPGIGLYQDPFDYGSTHHTNFDTYEEIYEPDLRAGAVEIAALVYALATSDEMVPRYPARDMPAVMPDEPTAGRLQPGNPRGKSAQ